jgi:DivIVA domain-containing protein
VALDRQSIARRDFPTARRGYDPAVVDAHLAAVADEVDQLRHGATEPVPAPAGLAARTSEQVRLIVEAAEGGAAAIREAAVEEARDHVARVAEAAGGLRERVDGLERELTGLVAALRAGAERVAEDLDAVAAAAADPALGRAGADGMPAPVLGVTVAQTGGAVVEEEVGDEPALAAVEAAPDATRQERLHDVIGARIVALEMATSGRPREETDRFLAERYDLQDRAALLDDVYARAQV